MGTYVDDERIKRARKADLYRYLVVNHPYSIGFEGNYLYLKEYDSLYVKKGASCFFRFSSQEAENSIDLLVNYLGYSFPDAVSALCEVPTSSAKSEDCIPRVSLVHSPVFPERGSFPFKKVFAYLTRSRRLSPEVVNKLICKGLIYQDINGNAVFINHSQTYCEIRGTYSDIKYHRSLRLQGGVPYWSVGVGKGNICKAYICEGCIDAISLYELHSSIRAIKEPTIYCSIGGVSKQKAIDCIAGLKGASVILAVDNDPAGEKCRQSTPSLAYILPQGKDWNDDLRRCKERL